MPGANLVNKEQELDNISKDVIGLLKKLIATPSFSREEDKTASLIEKFLADRGIKPKRKSNNIWVRNKFFKPLKPTILLNSHHDTVKPNAGYRLDPFTPIEQEGKLFGLGSNDAGGTLMALLGTFLYYYEKENLKYNFIYAATAEEENSGANGIELIIPELGNIDFAIVGEPTQMHLAIAEKGLMVLDCVTHGRSGHAAREEGDNAIYKAIRDIEWFRKYKFPKVSETLGPVKMTTTVIHAGNQHNMVPDLCEFTVDVRCTDAYTHEEVLEIIRQNINSEAKPRSMRMRPSSISKQHPFVQAGIKLGRDTYGSPTTSDQAVIPFTSVKLGPGDSARSHTADEYIYLHEIEEGIRLYIQMLDQII